jgi:hypothetical protein
MLAHASISQADISKAKPQHDSARHRATQGAGKRRRRRRGIPAARMELSHRGGGAAAGAPRQAGAPRR